MHAATNTQRNNKEASESSARISVCAPFCIVNVKGRGKLQRQTLYQLVAVVRELSSNIYRPRHASDSRRIRKRLSRTFIHSLSLQQQLEDVNMFFSFFSQRLHRWRWTCSFFPRNFTLFQENLIYCCHLSVFSVRFRLL